MYTILGPDISFYQDDPKTLQEVDFARMKSGSEFVIIRAGQNLGIDPKFLSYWQKAKTAGLPRGSYWFYDSRTNPKRQAELWVETLGSDLGELPLFADFEEKFNGEFGGWKNWYDFLERLRSLVGEKEIGIYTAFYYWRDHAPNAISEAQNLSYFAKYPLWIANYGASRPLVPQPWGENDWLFWQFTEIGNGKAFGVETKGIDLNYFNGTEELFQKRFDGTISVTPPPTQPPVLDQPPSTLPPCLPISNLYRTIANVLNLRQGPGTGFQIVGQLQMDRVVQGLRITKDGKWIEILTQDGTTGWCYSTYLEVIDRPKTYVPLKLQLFDKILFIREVLPKPRKLVANILFVDLHSEILEFFVTPSNGLSDYPMCSRTTADFLTHFRTQLAINGDSFSYKSVERGTNPCPNGGSPVKPNGLAASRGHVYSQGTKTVPTVYISQKNEMTFNSPPTEIYNAISGTEMLITNGEMVTDQSHDSGLDARTALGVSKNGRWLCLVVADGRAPNYSEGATLHDMASLLLRFGSYNAMLLDGGESSAMVMEGFSGHPVTLSNPLNPHTGIERPVANHLGIYLRKKKNRE